MDVVVFLILIAIAIPVGMYIGKVNDKHQGKNAKEWKEYKNKQEKLEELEEIMKELKGE